MDANQYTLDFTSRRNELIALTSGLSRVPLVVGGKVLSAGRVYGVIDLVKRLICLSSPAAVIDRDRLTVIAQVPYLGQRMESFRCVNERTIRRWALDARAIGVVEVNVRAHQFGNRNWNEWIVRFDRLREVGGHGRTWADTMPALGADTMPAPQIRELNPGEEMISRAGPVAARPGVEFLPDWKELRPFADERIEAITDEEIAECPDALRHSLLGQRAFEPLTEQWLKSDRGVRSWHAWQLRLSDQAVGSTRAHQLLTVAAARHASAFPRSRVRSSRVGIFVGIVAKRIWEPVRGRLEAVLADMAVSRSGVQFPGQT